jgi:hypothetical protein
LPEEAMHTLSRWAAAVAISTVATTTAHGQLVFNLTPDANLSANPAALAALNRAAQQWSGLFGNSVTINLSVGLSPMANSDTGLTTPVFLQGSYATIRNKLIADAAGNPALAITSSLPTTPTFNLPTGFTYSGNIALTRANAKAMGFAVGAGSDGTITFNSNFAFDYDNTNGVTPGTIDFQTIATHEIGHALGFDSAVDVVDGSPPTSILPNPLDLFRFRNLSGQFPTTAGQFSSFARDMIPGHDDVFSDTQLQLQFSTGANGGDGFGAGHWKDDALTGTYIGIMDPSVTTGTTEQITSNDVRALQMIGWEVTAVPEPSTLALVVMAAATAAGFQGCRERRDFPRRRAASGGEANTLYKHN